MLRRVDHVSLRVPSLRKAEELYRRLFDLEVAFREVETPEGWFTLPSGKGWEEATRSGARIGLSVLAREGLVLALEEKERVIPGERLQHIGLEGDEGELQRLEGLVWGLGGQVVTRGAGLLVFDDAYGVKWEITSHHALEPADRSSGARAGKWFRSPVAAQGHRGG